MTRIVPPIGTPAYRYASNWTPPYTEKLAWRIKKLLVRLTEVLFGCNHRHISLPYMDHQTCIDCGAWRSYLIGESIAPTDAPIWIGRWKKGPAPVLTGTPLPKPLALDPVPAAPFTPPPWWLEFERADLSHSLAAAKKAARQ